MDKTEIDIEAEALARRHDIDCERVRAIFNMLAEVGWLAPNFPYNTLKVSIKYSTILLIITNQNPVYLLHQLNDQGQDVNKSWSFGYQNGP